MRKVKGNTKSVAKNKSKTLFCVKIIPNSSRTIFAGMLGDKFKIKVSAQPERSKANKCLVEFLQKKLNLKGKDITIVSGAFGPIKHIEVKGLSLEDVSIRLSG